MVKFQIISEIKDFKPSNSRKIREALNHFNGNTVRITIEKNSSNRSHPQNRYYWGVVVMYQVDCFKERWGEIWDSDEVHDWNKNNIWHTEFVDEATGEMIKKPGSSKAKTKAEFEERLEKLRQKFYLDFDWKIPLPNEEISINFNE